MIALYLASTAFILYFTLRPYVFSAVQLIRRGAFAGLGPVQRPMVSVIIPTYNERRAVERLLSYVLSFDYPSYEVIFADDSNDGTYELLRSVSDPRVKVLHRNNRRGWKAGAINDALELVDPRSRYVIILDADSVPPRDLLTRLVERIEQGYDVVQGVQLPVLNSESNSIAKANTIIQAYYQLIEQPSKFVLGLPVTITGSNFIIRTDLIKRYRLNEDIGEDWELTLRLAKDGYRIAYAPDIAVRCEVPFNLKESITQYIRWNEGMVRYTFRRLSEVMDGDMPVVNRVDLIMTGLTPFITYALLISSVTGAYLYLSYPSVRSIVILFTLITFVSGLLTMVSSASKVGLGYLYAVFSELMYFVFVPAAIYAAVRGIVMDRGEFIRTTKRGISYLSS
ncbi:MAG: glycosyltransferase [Nitrososphaeria archaeon]